MRCSVSNCPSKTNCEKNLFFPFPKDKTLKNKWVKFCNTKNQININSARVCPKHFKPEHFLKNKKGKIAGLKPNVVPSVEFPIEEVGPLQLNEEYGMNCDIFETVALNILKSFGPRYACNTHNEVFQYVCEDCKILLCRICIPQGHVNHTCLHISDFASKGRDILQVLLESSHLGINCLGNCINNELDYARFIDGNCDALIQNIRNTFRPIIAAIKARERFLLDFVEKIRKKRMENLYEQMTALKSAFFALMDANGMLQHLAANGHQMDDLSIAMKLVEGNGQIEISSKIFKEQHPRNEFFKFYEPLVFKNLLNDIKSQGSVELEESHLPKDDYAAASMDIISDLLQNSGDREMLFSSLLHIVKQKNKQGIDVEIAPNNLKNQPTRSKNTTHVVFGEAVPGWINKIKVFRSDVPTLAFATRGSGDGQVSRPFGVCVTKMGQILVTDRRNCHVQAFGVDGRFLFKFGRKGNAKGEFDSPAGICVDKSGRIIVADKNNHRIQVFSSGGKYLLSFGELGSQYGKLKFPFDVAVNTKLQIAVADTANHRIQQFEHNGRFIRQIPMGTLPSTGYEITPRGLCYTPTGKIIVTDYTNHCLHLIEPEKNKIVSTKGNRGTGNFQFTCPTGVCCDDEGAIIVADSHNHRIVVFSANLEFLWSIDVRPSVNHLDMAYFNETDRTCDVALTRDGRIVFVTEMLPANEATDTTKRFIHVY